MVKNEWIGRGKEEGSIEEFLSILSEEDLIRLERRSEMQGKRGLVEILREEIEWRKLINEYGSKAGQDS